MMNLPEDVVADILLRLPVQSLLRFGCVCKQSYAQISSPLFREMHLVKRIAMGEGDDDDDELIVANWSYKSGKRNVLSFYDDYKSLGLLKQSSNHDFDFYKLSLTTHANGIVCVTNLKHEYQFNITLLNPVLREIREIPVQPFGSNLVRRAVGFGFDVATMDYIVVQVVSFMKEDLNGEFSFIDHKGLVYHLTTDSWKMVEMPTFVSASYFSDLLRPLYEPLRTEQICTCVFSHGCIHWCIGWESNHYRILTFNVTNESFQEIQFPHAWSHNAYRAVRAVPYLFTVDNCIAMVAASRPNVVQVIEVWMMKEYGITESWTKDFSICFSETIKKPLSFWKKDKLLLLTTDRKLICYDRFQDQLCPLLEQDDPICLPYSEEWSLDVVTCHASLVSIKQNLSNRRHKLNKKVNYT